MNDENENHKIIINEKKRKINSQFHRPHNVPIEEEER